MSKKRPDHPPSAGYSDAAKTVVQQTTLRVQEMHRAIAAQSFDVLTKVPLVSGPAQFIQNAHDAISSGVYAAIHHGAGGLLGAASLLEKSSTGFTDEKPPGRLASGLRSALNGAFGDHLAASNNRLAIAMALHLDGVPLTLEAAALRSAFPMAGKRICLFIHGLSCDEHCWKPGKEPSETECEFGLQLQSEFGYTPLYLRYNTGLPIADNGAQLASFLDQLIHAWPEPDCELVIIGHSMGGLIALAACQQASSAAFDWPHSTRMLICLGSPHLGSPVERLGHLAHGVLNQSKITAPLGKIASARSQGVKDLRHGPGAPDQAKMLATLAYRFLGGSLAGDADHPFSEFFGDGLVTPSSATTHDMTGDVQSAKLGGIGHMELLTDRRVYRQIRDWLI
ncbi:MAG: alpha/beta fold hydrolase [Dechloromonas sp.]|jgi:pimeloyl-ACP methyl ester carboxylesterase|uniref:Alpha/beta fold hydrolase n=1 Tax=Candidatus Dechloromonas phosphorivorans TaxID=2899244 RepID=A0A935MSP4_9RHOO|nr:alpha/beta fold hydrolase [Candidatus Dechloromonas phosphorivorans]